MRFIKGIVALSALLTVSGAMAQSQAETQFSHTNSHTYSVFVDETKFATTSEGGTYQEFYKCICETSSQHAAGSNLEARIDTNHLAADATANKYSYVLSARTNAGADALSATNGFAKMAAGNTTSFAAGGDHIPYSDFGYKTNGQVDVNAPGFMPNIASYVNEGGQARNAAGTVIANNGGADAIAGNWDFVIYGDKVGADTVGLDCKNNGGAATVANDCTGDVKAAMYTAYANVRVYNTNCGTVHGANASTAANAVDFFTGGAKDVQAAAAATNSIYPTWNCSMTGQAGRVAQTAVIGASPALITAEDGYTQVGTLSTMNAGGTAIANNASHLVQHRSHHGGGVLDNCDTSQTFRTANAAAAGCGDHPFVGVHMAVPNWAKADTYQINLRITGKPDTH